VPSGDKQHGHGVQAGGTCFWGFAWQVRQGQLCLPITSCQASYQPAFKSMFGAAPGSGFVCTPGCMGGRKCPILVAPKCSVVAHKLTVSSVQVSSSADQGILPLQMQFRTSTRLQLSSWLQVYPSRRSFRSKSFAFAIEQSSCLCNGC
jgi:hypothetical protein